MRAPRSLGAHAPPRARAGWPWVRWAALASITSLATWGGGRSAHAQAEPTPPAPAPSPAPAPAPGPSPSPTPVPAPAPAASEPPAWDPNAATAPAPAADAAPAASAAPPAPIEPVAPAEGSGLRWRVPPVSWSGSLAYDLRLERADGEPRSTQHLVTAMLGGSSYLYQPWFATVSGQLGLTTGRVDAAGDAGSSSDRFVTGGLRLDLFPRSRFPFDMHYEVTDSRIDAGLAPTVSFRARDFGFTQRYRPEGGGWSASATFNRREQQSAEFGTDRQDSLTADFTSGWQNHSVAVNLADTHAERDNSDESTRFRTVVARHSYVPGQVLSIETSANWARTDNRLATGSADLSVAQWSSLAFWRPNSTVTVSGSARALSLREESNGAPDGQSLDSAGGTLGLTWEATRHLRVAGNVNGVVSDNESTRTKSLVGSLGGTWQGDTIELDEFQYDWFAGATGSAARATGQSERALSLQLGHTLARSWVLSPEQSLNFTLGQTLSAQRTAGRNGNASTSGLAGRDNVTRLDTHSAAMAWNTQANGSNYFMRASASDSREIGGAASRFQLFNFQLSGNWEIDRDQTLSGDLTLQRIRQRSSDSVDAADPTIQLPGQRQGSNSSGGEITYRHQRWLDTPRLRLTLRAKLAQDVLKQSDALLTIPDRETRLAEARIDYAIGRLDTSLVLRASQIDGRWRELLMWRVQRSFGGVLL